MKDKNLKSIHYLASLLFVLFAFGFYAYSSDQDAQSCYTDVLSFDNGFVAVSNTGKIEWLNENGELIQTWDIEGEVFTNVLLHENNILVAGKNGFWISTDDHSEFYLLESEFSSAINSIASFRNKLIVANDDKLSVGIDVTSLKPIPLELKGKIVSLSTNGFQCYGVTNEGEIIHSTDGINWTVFNFNTVYNGFYKTCSFRKVVFTSNQIAVVGINEDGSPALFFSSKGNVWTERSLFFTDEEGKQKMLNEIPSDIFYDETNDQFILSDQLGEIMSIPSCSHCQKRYRITKDKLNAIAGNELKLIIVGDNNFIKKINLNNI